MKQVIVKGKVLFLILEDISTLILIVFFMSKTGWIIVWNIWFSEIKVDTLELI